jgi:hypothetical protein
MVDLVKDEKPINLINLIQLNQLINEESFFISYSFITIHLVHGAAATGFPVPGGQHSDDAIF